MASKGQIMDKNKLLELIRTNGWFSYKELQSYFGMTKNQIKYLLVDKHKIRLKEEFIKLLFSLFDKGFKPIDINNKYKHIPISTIYHYYKKWRKEPINRTNISKKKLTIRLAKCKYSLNCYKNKYNTSPDKVKRILRDYNMLDWFYKKQKEYKLINNNKKYKKGELKNKLFKLFNKYPNSINKSSSYLANFFECSVRDINRLKKQYKDLYE